MVILEDALAIEDAGVHQRAQNMRLRFAALRLDGVA
jgi:hypothetical protein